MPKDDSGTSCCAYYEQLYYPYWGYKRWATWLEGEVHTLRKRKTTTDCTLGVCQTLFSTSMNQAGKLGKVWHFNLWKGNRPWYFAAFSTHHDHSWELIIPGLSLFLWGDTKWVSHLNYNQKSVSITSCIHNTNSECNFVLCLWRNKYERPLAMGGKRAKPIRALQWNHSPSHGESICLLKISIIRN
jgi:hypothetical protein